ncbi:hypothetical protein [Panthera leo polyomavirus 1]|uniref:Agnoprotein n=1 Tax=Panthera leo polyomavirus 1 TaxID=2170405 RepID=A0A2S1CJN2_9POLY|nr:hypothetical protein [Panthera leo polyomavirus 1]AWD33764.1 hypothetical protein [Panthera leo polyomavirus 1]AWD33775.1 hypothetical protein [Panthera leo polyomavirus 1]
MKGLRVAWQSFKCFLKVLQLRDKPANQETLLELIDLLDNLVVLFKECKEFKGIEISKEEVYGVVDNFKKRMFNCFKCCAPKGPKLVRFVKQEPPPVPLLRPPLKRKLDMCPELTSPDLESSPEPLNGRSEVDGIIPGNSPLAGSLKGVFPGLTPEACSACKNLQEQVELMEQIFALCDDLKTLFP